MYYLFIIHKGARVEELECGQGVGTRQGGWVDNGTVLCAYFRPASDDNGGDDDDSLDDNEKVVTEKTRTTWPGRGLLFFP